MSKWLHGAQLPLGLNHNKALGTLSPAPHQGSGQVQPLMPITSLAWSPWVGAVTSKLPSRAWLMVVVAQGAEVDLVPLRRLLRRCRL